LLFRTKRILRGIFNIVFSPLTADRFGSSLPAGPRRPPNEVVLVPSLLASPRGSKSIKNEGKHVSRRRKLRLGSGGQNSDRVCEGAGVDLQHPVEVHSQHSVDDGDAGETLGSNAQRRSRLPIQFRAIVLCCVKAVFDGC
jgi:hypothetical protein